MNTSSITLKVSDWTWTIDAINRYKYETELCASTKIAINSQIDLRNTKMQSATLSEGQISLILKAFDFYTQIESPEVRSEIHELMSDICEQMEHGYIEKPTCYKCGGRIKRIEDNNGNLVAYLCLDPECDTLDEDVPEIDNTPKCRDCGTHLVSTSGYTTPNWHCQRCERDHAYEHTNIFAGDSPVWSDQDLDDWQAMQRDHEPDDYGPDYNEDWDTDDTTNLCVQCGANTQFGGLCQRCHDYVTKE